MSSLQARAAEMITRHGFVGVPMETFEPAGRNQFIALLESGLTPQSTVLDIGCGTLRAGYWLIHFLRRGHYCGIEPARERVELGLRYIVPRSERWRKRPRFEFNSWFDASAFATRFDFFLAGSIWTHASKAQIESTLDEFLAHTTPKAALLTTYLPPRVPDEEYLGTNWVGTSHESATPGIVRHSLSWITERCDERGLAVDELELKGFDDQLWLRVLRGSSIEVRPA